MVLGLSHVSGQHRIMEPSEEALVTLVLEMGSVTPLDHHRSLLAE